MADVNDNAPTFPRSVYEVSVEEDKEVGFVIITVTANDHDEGQSWPRKTQHRVPSQVTFISIAPNHRNVSKGFTCPQLGNISTSPELERVSAIKFQVFAQNNQG